ncbi:MAG: biotin--[acetyl-CoA-carboxylase] ligase [Devosiaceae bacterium]|nr:biotin--[acetyl-CoA-carboxylase] ligase [Devosiaceae bacterium]
MDDFQLHPIAISAGHSLKSFCSVGSTNQVAAREVADGQADNLWIVAGEQTAGRARRGRSWQTVSGNLAASIALNMDHTVNATHLLGFVAAIAVARTVSTLLPKQFQEIRVKWPNDVMVGKAKLVGILLEAVSRPDKQRSVIVGMGINITSAPTDLPYEATYINQYDKSITGAEVFKELTKNWVEVYSLWDYDRGRSAILDQWRQVATGIGKSISVRGADNEVQGTFNSIDEEGRLIIVLANGQKEIITAGDVVF